MTAGRRKTLAGDRVEETSIRKIISGGQTGVDRGALDVALDLGIACGGWCPAGRRAADGVIPAKYPLQETASANYAERTRLNVLDADGTLILHAGALAGGTALTAAIARELDKPLRVVSLDGHPQPGEVAVWLGKQRIEVLNVAGPREEEHPGIRARAAGFLRRVLQP